MRYHMPVDDVGATGFWNFQSPGDVDNIIISVRRTRDSTETIAVARQNLWQMGVYEHHMTCYEAGFLLFS